MYRDLNPLEVKKILDNKNGTRLIDVREEWEYNIARIENSELMPLSSFISNMNTLNENDELIIYCHKGVRSASVCSYLAGKGFNKLINLKGGIDAWSDEIDRSIPHY